MPETIEDVEARHGNPGQPGRYRVACSSGNDLYIYAKDELDAYTKALAIIKEEEKQMRTLTVCVTVALLVLLSAITYACESRREDYALNMKQCVAVGKSFVSEDGGYSCRDPNAVPKPEGE